MDTPDSTSSSTANSSPYHAPHAIGDTGPRTTGLIGPKWRYSPFYRIDQAVSVVQECPESTSWRDKRFNFYLNANHLAKLGSRSPKYQLRLYCTTSEYYTTLGTSFCNLLCPIEFPPTCDVRINNRVLVANFCGIKKKAGTAPPADITNLCNRGAPGVKHAVEMIYVNSTLATRSKKIYLVVNLVEVTSVDQLVERLRKRLKPMEQVIATIKAQQVDGDEVQAGPTKLSLRDPLTYTRINHPCRAPSCVHIGCFDAMCWYAMMEQTPTWLCPICDRVLDPDELVIDGFIANILAKVHEDVDYVIIEPDGEWHTEDRMAGSVAWKQKDVIGPKWRYSPFYRIDQAVSVVQECPEAGWHPSRFNFYLNADQLAKLGSRSPKYQLRLYCTTSEYYTTFGTSFCNVLCPVEFPSICEIRINTRVLVANFCGIQDKVGTAPSDDITELCNHGAPGVGNAVEMIYMNLAAGIEKFYLVVNLVEVTSVDELVEKLRIKPMAQVIASIKAQQVDDDEVQSGPTKLSLRDPLTFTRINHPCRASSCVHIGCFDAMCWYAKMEQTPTWLCPICDRVLDPDELIIVGFIANILAKVHEDVDYVMIEPDGEWHTEDRTAGSVAWMQKYGTAEATKASQRPKRTVRLPRPTEKSGPSIITIGDSSKSEEEAVREVMRQVSSLLVSIPALRPVAPEVIDLTLSDSGEEGDWLAPPPTRRQPAARR